MLPPLERHGEADKVNADSKGNQVSYIQSSSIDSSRLFIPPAMTSSI